MADETNVPPATPPATSPGLEAALRAYLEAVAPKPDKPVVAPVAAPVVKPVESPAEVELRSFLRRIEAEAKVADARSTAEKEAKLSENVGVAVKSGDPTAIKEAMQRVEDAYKSRLTAREDDTKAVQAKYHKSLIDLAVRDSTFNVEFATPKAKSLALESLEKRLKVVTDANGVESVVEKKTELPANESIKAWLASEDADFMLAPSYRGKGGIGNGGSASPTTLPRSGPLDVVELVKRGIAAQRAAQSGGLPQTVGI